MEIIELNTTPGKKNFKQAQLSFKPVDNKITLPKNCLVPDRKRKSEEPASDSNETKSLKISNSPKSRDCKVVVINCSVSHKPLRKPIVNGNYSSAELKKLPISGGESENKDEMDVDTTEDDNCVTNGVPGSDLPSVITVTSDEGDSCALNSSAVSAVNSSFNNSDSSDELEKSGENKEITQSSQGSSTDCPELKSDDVKIKNCDEPMNRRIPTSDDAKNSEAPAVVSRKTETTEDEKQPRKRRKMSSAEAKLKAEQRAQKLKEKEQEKLEKEKELFAKKEERRLERERKQQEKKKKIEEKQKKKEHEEKMKLEKKEQEEKEKLRKQQEKEEKNRLKQQALEAKIEEKKKKEEQKLKALEEKKKAEEEKKKTEEEKKKAEEKKIEKTKAAFASYFLKGKTTSPPQVSQISNSEQGNFRPFQIKENMSLAPVIPKAAQERFDRENLDELISTQACQELYLGAIRSSKHQAYSHKKVKCKKTEDDDVVILDCKEDEETTVDLHLKAKLLQFCDNIRPPYWGTWRKTSKNVRPRNPFARDGIFDYDVDSDDEWDEGGPGESLSGTEDEESEDDYEVDNEFFVPHGYLSPEEEKDDEDDANISDPELQRARLKLKAREFESERSKKTIQLKPSIIGCYWEMDSEIGNPLCAKSLQQFCAVVLVPLPIATAFSLPKSKVDDNSSLKPDRAGLGGENSPKSAAFVKRPVPEEAIPYLIQLLHANTNGRQVVVKEFQEFWQLHCMKEDPSNKSTEAPTVTALSPAANEKCAVDSNQTVPAKPQPYKISVKQLNLTIREISEWCRCPNASLKKYCWWVHEKVREKHGFADLPVPNKWNYVTRKEVENTLPAAQSAASSLKGFLNI